MGENRRERKYKTRVLPRLFIISAEDSKTAKAYFEHIKDRIVCGIAISVIADKTKTSSKYVLDRIKKHLSNRNKMGKLLQKGDEAWIVIDRDNWEETEIENCYNWSKKKLNTILH